MEQHPECTENKAVTEKKPVSILCVAGFVLACLGSTLIFAMFFWPGDGDAIIWTIVGAIIAEVVALVLSLIGVVTASKNRLRLRGLGIAGIVISGIIINLVVMGVLGVLLFHESPPRSTMPQG